MGHLDRGREEHRFRSDRERDRARDRGSRDPRERPYARDRERRTEFRGPEFEDGTGYASRYPSRPPERDPRDRDEPFEGFGEERPQNRPGYGRAERFGSEAAGYGRERLHDPVHDEEARGEHERRRRDHEGIGEYGRGGEGDRERARGGDEPRRRSEGRPEPRSYEEQRHAPSSGDTRFVGSGGGGYQERRQGGGTAHPGSSRWVEGGRLDEHSESITDDPSRYSRPYSGRPSERIDEWARGSAERPSGGYAGRGPRSYRRSDDRIREDVCEQLTNDGDVDATDIEVAVSDGEVTLEGRVESREMKHRAEGLAHECAGVREVHNHLRVASS